MKITLSRWRQSITGPLLIVGFEEGLLWYAIGAGLVWWQWLIAAVGYLGIIYVMFSGARRLELRQNEVYRHDPDYQAYVKKTPILIPLLPLYSVERYKWLQA